MNKIYKLIWSKVKNCYVVASELAKSRSKAPNSGVVGALSLEKKIFLALCSRDYGQSVSLLNTGFLAGTVINPSAFAFQKEVKPFKITVAAIVKNEAEHVSTWVQAARSCADEIVVVDTGSTDGTVERFADYGIKCFHYDWNDDFASAKNYMISLCHGDWIVLLDGDEWFREGCDVRKAIAKHHGNPVTKAIIADWICLDKDRGNAVMFSGGAVRAFRNQPDVRYFRKVHENLTINYENFVFEPDFKMYHTGYSGSVNRSKHERNLRIMRTMFDFDNGKVEYPTDWRYIEDTYAGLGQFDKALWAADKMISFGVQEYSAAAWITKFNVLFAMKTPLMEMMKQFDYCFRTVPSVSGFRFLASIYFFRNGQNALALDNYIEGLRMLMGPQDKVAMEHTYWRMYMPEASALASTVYLKNKQLEAALYACKVCEQYCGFTHWTNGALADVRRLLNQTEEDLFGNILERVLPVLKFSKKAVLSTALASTLSIGMVGITNPVFAGCVVGGSANSACGNNAVAVGGYVNKADANGSVVVGGCYNNANGICSIIVGGKDNLASGLNSSVFGGLCNYAGNGYSYTSSREFFISPSCYNLISDNKISVNGVEYDVTLYTGDNSSVLGGIRNLSLGNQSVVVGGDSNVAACYRTVTIGGCCNIALGQDNVVIGGHDNTASCFNNAVVGGIWNVASCSGTFIGGGRLNKTMGYQTSILGGDSNIAYGQKSTIIGGCLGSSYACYSTVIGGGITGNAECATTALGSIAIGKDATTTHDYEVTIGSSCAPITIGGNMTVTGTQTVTDGTTTKEWSDILTGATCFADGVVLAGYMNTASGCYSSVSGGRCNTASGYNSSVTGGCCNIASCHNSSVSGGYGNTASRSYASVSGGCCNTASCNYSSVSGGSCNIASGCSSSVSGGFNNTASGNSSSVTGGQCNLANCWYSSVSGGRCNNASGCYSSVSGGTCNIASCDYASISGGNCNTASGVSSSVSGGCGNLSSGKYSSVIGGCGNVASSKLLRFTYELVGDDTSSSGTIDDIDSVFNAVNTGYFTLNGVDYVYGGNSGGSYSFYNPYSLTYLTITPESTQSAVVTGGVCNYALGEASLAAGGCEGKAYADYSSAIGGGITGNAECTTTALGSVAIGKNATTTRDYEVAIGSACAPVKLDGALTVDGAKTVSDGTNQKTWEELLSSSGGASYVGVNIDSGSANEDGSGATGTDAIAIGKGAVAFGDKSLSIGIGNIVKGNRSGAIGDPNIVDGSDSYIVGNNSTVNANVKNAFVLGNNSTVNNGLPVNWATMTDAEKEAWANGLASTDIKEGVVALGNNISVSLDNKSFTSRSSTSPGTPQIQHVVALGDNVIIGEENTIGIGHSATATALDAIAIGDCSQATMEGTIAVGESAQATNAFANALGYLAQASGEGAGAFGQDAQATGKFATAFGRSTRASAESATAIGNTAHAVSQSSIAIGTSAVANGGANTNAVAIGRGAVIGSDSQGYGETVALGSGTSVQNTFGSAVGSSANVTGQKGTAVGYNSSVTALNSVALGADSVADTANTVSVGSSTSTRKIVNVTDGTADTDVSTLGQTGNQLALSNGSLQLKNANGTVLNSVTLPQGNTYTAGNGLELDSNNEFTVKTGMNVSVDANGVNVVGNGIVSNGNAGLISGDSLYDEVRLSTDGTYAKVANTTVQNLTALDTQVKANADAIASLPAVPQNVVSYDDTTHENITLDGPVGTGTKITGLANGTLSSASTDAVTGQQLYQTNAEITRLDSSITSQNTTIANLSTSLTTLNTDYNLTKSSFNTVKTQVDTGFNVTADGALVKTVTPSCNFINFVGGKGIALTNSNGSLSIAVDGDASIASGDTGAVTGGVAYTELRPVNGNYVVQANTTAQNLTALDTQLKTTTDNLATEITNRQTAVSNEATVRQQADTALTNKIGSIDADGNYITKDGSVFTNLSALDTQLKTVADNAGALSADGNYILQANTVAQNLQALDNKIGSVASANGNYTTTSNTVNANIKALDTQLKSTTDNLAQEVTDRTNVVTAEASARSSEDANLSGRIGTVADGTYNYIQQSSTKNVAENLVLLDSALKTTNDTVASNKTAIESSLATEVSARELVDTTLQTHIDNEVTARETAVSGEATARATADTTLQGNIDTLSAIAVKYDSADAKDKVTLTGTNGTTIDNLKDATLSATSKEAVTGSQLFATNTNFATEVTNRINADTALSDRIGIVSADGNYIKASSTYDVAQNLDSLDTAVKANADAIEANKIEFVGVNEQWENWATNSTWIKKFYGVTNEAEYNALKAARLNSHGEGASGGQSVAIGRYASATSYQSTAVGDAAKATLSNASAFGENAQASGTFATAIGSGSKSTDSMTVALGSGAEANAERSVALGGNSSVLGSNSVAIGYASKVKAGEDRVVSFGQDAYTIGSVTTPEATLRLIHVAAGVNDTDAVNVSQLNDATTKYFGVNAVWKDWSDLTNAEKSELAVTTEAEYDILKSSGANIHGDGAVGANSIAIGKNARTSHPTLGYSTDSVAIGTNALSTGEGSVAIGLNASTYGGSPGIAIGNNAKTLLSTGISIGNNAQSQNLGIAIGSNSRQLDGNEGITIGYDINSIGTDNILIGNLTHTKDYNNPDATDLEKNHRDVIAIGYNASGSDFSVSLGRNSKTGYGAIALGLDSDADSFMGIAIGEQAKAKTSYSNALGAYANAEGVESTAIGYSAVASGCHGAVVGDYSRAEGDDSAAFGTMSYAHADKSVSLGTYASVFSGNDGSMALGYHAQVSAPNSVALGSESKVIAGQCNVLSLGKDAIGDVGDDDYVPELTRRIIHVADGISDSDVATVGQIRTAVSNGLLTADGIVEKDNTGVVSGGTVWSALNTGRNLGSSGINRIGTNTMALGGVMNVVEGTDSMSIGSDISEITGEHSFVMGSHGANIPGHNSVSLNSVDLGYETYKDDPDFYNRYLVDGGGTVLISGNNSTAIGTYGETKKNPEGSSTVWSTYGASRITGDTDLVLGGSRVYMNGNKSVSLGGEYVNINGNYDVSIGGFTNTVQGNDSFTLGGTNSYITGDMSGVIGSSLTNYDSAATDIPHYHDALEANKGLLTTVSGDGSLSIGNYGYAEVDSSGEYSYILYGKTTIAGNNSINIGGYQNKITSNKAMTINSSNVEIVGDGDSSIGSSIISSGSGALNTPYSYPKIDSSTWSSIIASNSGKMTNAHNSVISGTTGGSITDSSSVFVGASGSPCITSSYNSVALANGGGYMTNSYQAGIFASGSGTLSNARQSAVLANGGGSITGSCQAAIVAGGGGSISDSENVADIAGGASSITGSKLSMAAATGGGNLTNTEDSAAIASGGAYMTNTYNSSIISSSGSTIQTNNQYLSKYNTDDNLFVYSLPTTGNTIINGGGAQIIDSTGSLNVGSGATILNNHDSMVVNSGGARLNGTITSTSDHSDYYGKDTIQYNQSAGYNAAVYSPGSYVEGGFYNSVLFANGGSSIIASCNDAVGSNNVIVGMNYTESGTDSIKGASSSLIVHSANSSIEDTSNSALYSTVTSKISDSSSSLIVGGVCNTVQKTAGSESVYQTIVAGSNNKIDSYAPHNMIIGGRDSSIELSATAYAPEGYNLIISSPCSVIRDAQYSQILGGSHNQVESDNVIVAGWYNRIDGGSNCSFVAGHNNGVYGSEAMAYITGQNNFVDSQSWGIIYGLGNRVENLNSTGYFFGSGNKVGTGDYGGGYVLAVGANNDLNGDNIFAYGRKNKVSDGESHNSLIVGDDNDITYTYDDTIIGSCNTVHDGSYSNIIFGSRNILNDSSYENEVHGSDNTIGEEASTSVIIGSCNSVGACSYDNLVIGKGNTVAAEVYESTAMGYNSFVSASCATAISGTVGEDGENALAILGTANAEDAIAIGNSSSVTGANSIAIGKGQIVTGSNSGAFGDPSVINGDNSYSVGNNNTVATNTSDVFVLGNNVVTSVSDVVVLGKDSAGEVTGTVSLGRNAYTKIVHNDQTGEDEEVTVPELTRRITHVTSGVNDTDAVNVSQLNALSDTVIANKTHFFGVNSTNEYDMNYDGGGAVGANAVAIGTNAWANTDNSIAIGATSATMFGEKAIAVGYLASALAENAVAVGPSAQAPNAFATAVGSKAIASGCSSTAIGKNAYALAKNSIAVGSDSTALEEDEFSVGRPAVEANAETGQQAYPEVKRRITHVDTGVNDTDAVNFAQLRAETTARTDADTALSDRIGTLTSNGNYVRTDKSLAENLAILDTQMDTASGTLSNAILYDAADKTLATMAGVGGTKLTNLKAGTLSSTSTDAVIGAQLYATNQNIAGFAADINRNKQSIRDMNASVSTALESVSSTSLLVDTINGLKADASLNNLTAAGQQVIATAAANAVQEYMAAYGTGSSTNNATPPMAPMMMSSNSNTLNVTDAGNGSLHVGEGSVVNGSQSIAIGVGNQVNANNSGAFGDPSIINADESYVLGNDDTINTGATGSFIVGNDSVSNAEGSMIFGSNVTSDGKNSVALGNTTKVSGDNSVALGSGSLASEDNVVSLGNSDLKRRIVNLQDGTVAKDSSDAVTGG